MSHSLKFNNSSSYDINVYRDPAGYGGNVWDKQAVSENHDTGAYDWQSAQRMHSDKPVEWDKPSDISAEPAYPYGLISRTQQSKSEKWTESSSSSINPGWLYGDIPKSAMTKSQRWDAARLTPGMFRRPRFGLFFQDRIVSTMRAGRHQAGLMFHCSVR